MSNGDFGNLNKHLLIHEISKKWYKLYQAYSGDEINLDDGISEEKLNLIKFFVTSNIALAALENVFLRNILKDEIQMPSIKTFNSLIWKKWWIKCTQRLKKN